MSIIFAFAVLAFPATMLTALKQSHPTGFIWALGSRSFNPVYFYERYLAPGSAGYLIEFATIIFFTFFYASIIPSMQPKKLPIT